MIITIKVETGFIDNAFKMVVKASITIFKNVSLPLLLSILHTLYKRSVYFSFFNLVRPCDPAAMPPLCKGVTKNSCEFYLVQEQKNGIQKVPKLSLCNRSLSLH